jgi:ATP/maltotriose-dependent transcriptional regulator MalT
MMVLGRYGVCREITGRRLALVGRIRDPLEVGDIHSVAAWVRVYTGLNHEGLALARRGFELTRDEMPSAALHCQAWVALAQFRLGDWAEFFSAFEGVRALLGDRRDEPPYFASRPFGAAAYVYDVQGDDAAADRVLESIEEILMWRGQAVEGTRLASTRALAALAYGRRGDFDRARAYLGDLLDQPASAAGPLVVEAACDLTAMEGAWTEAPRVLEAARVATEEGDLLFLPAFADRLEGRWRIASGDPRGAAASLERAHARFDELEARWEVACTELDLCTALVEAADTGRVPTLLEHAIAVFDEVSARQELASARELLSEVQ